MRGVTKQVPSFFSAQQFESGPGQDFPAAAEQYRSPGLGAQQDALAMWRAQATGQAPSLANATLQQGIEQNQRAAMGLLGSARGGNIGAAYGQALSAQQGANVAAAQQAAINRMAEQQAAIQGIAGVGGQLSQLGLGYAGLGQGAYDAMAQRDLEWRLGKRGLDLQQRGQDTNFWMNLATAGIGAVGSGLGAAAVGGG